MKRQAQHTTVRAVSTQTAHDYRTRVQNEERVYERVEPSISTVMASKQIRPISPKKHESVFGDLPRDGEG